MTGFATGLPDQVTGADAVSQNLVPSEEKKESKEDAPLSIEADAKQTDVAESDSKAAVAPVSGGGDGTSTGFDNGTALLSVHNTPDFMLLPLELQGFCPWTVVHAKGLLIPGKPNLGVVRYDNMYFVCDHEVALKAFIRNPDYYLNQIRMKALHHPEYIHLLRLQRWFPSTSISRLLEQNDFDPRAIGGQPATRDAATSTPTHFVDSYIDVNYHWNEWELRRRALKVVALKNCATSSVQTDNSHYRRDNETQVYEQREKNTQTKRDQGTNPKITTTFVAGLRGHLAPDAKAVSKFIMPDDVEDAKRAESKDGGVDDMAQAKSEDKLTEEQKLMPRVVHLTLDL